MNIPQPQLRHQDIILTLYALYCRPPMEGLPIAALIKLLSKLGYDAQGVRSAVSRLKQNQILEPTKIGTAAGYRLTDEVEPILAEGDSRIFSECPDNHGTEWILATFSVPESKRQYRHQIRRTLTELGFGTVSSALWIAPAGNAEEAMAIFTRRHLDQYVEFFRGHYLHEDILAQRIKDWWDLPKLRTLIDTFLSHYDQADLLWRNTIGTNAMAVLPTASPELCAKAFCFYVPMLTLWRRLPYRIPQINADLMPKDWGARRARESFVGTHRLIAPLASYYAYTILSSSTDPDSFVSHR